ncbi:MAG: hypothetical protein GXO10_01740 [Crenarchaeota archaeon]|nr:hypothetical protein [Thermoproteota archaeon]
MGLVVVCVVFGVGGVFDFLWRVVPDWVWAGCVPGVVFTVLYVLSCGGLGSLVFFSYVSSLVVGLVFALLCYLFDLTGGADVKGFLCLGLACPPVYSETLSRNVLFTVLNVPTVAVVCNSAVAVLAYAAYIVLINVRKFRLCPESEKIRGLRKILYMVSTVCVPVREILKRPHKYALASVRIGDMLILRPVTRIVYRDPVEELKKYMEAGVLGENDHVLAIYYIPYVTCMFIGVLIYALTGNIFLTMYQLLKSLL